MDLVTKELLRKRTDEMLNTIVNTDGRTDAMTNTIHV